MTDVALRKEFERAFWIVIASCALLFGLLIAMARIEAPSVAWDALLLGLVLGLPSFLWALTPVRRSRMPGGGLRYFWACLWATAYIHGVTAAAQLAGQFARSFAIETGEQGHALVRLIGAVGGALLWTGITHAIPQTRRLMRDFSALWLPGRI